MERRLYRSNTDKMLFGVCGGLAEYFSVDPTIVRVGMVVAALLNGVGIVLYLALAIVMPRKPLSPPETGTGPPASESAPAGPSSGRDTSPSTDVPPGPPADSDAH